MQPLAVNIALGDMFESADVLAGKAFIDAISRGGLTKPSHLTYITSVHASHVWRFIENDSHLLKTMFEARNARALFIEIFVQQLQDDYTKS